MFLKDTVTPNFETEISGTSNTTEIFAKVDSV